MRTEVVVAILAVVGIAAPVRAGEEAKSDPCAEQLAIAYKRIADLEAQVAKLQGADGARTIEEATDSVLQPHDPIHCDGKDTLRLSNVHIKATDLDGAAIRAEGHCYVVISDSILEGPTGIWLMGRAHVVVKSSSVKGLRFGASLEGHSTLTAQSTTFYGKLNRQGRATYTDVGGSAWPDAPAVEEN